MIKAEIQALFFKLLCDPDGFTLAQLRDLEGKLEVYEKAKAMRLDLDLIEDQQMVSGVVVV